MKPSRTIVTALWIAFGPCLGVFAFSIAVWPGDDASIWAPSLNLTNVVAISGGDGHAMALRADGTIVSWSGPYSAEMGVTNAVQIASGWCHDLAVLADGRVVEWGLVPPNCGSTAPGATSMPPGLTNIMAAAGGHTHSLVLKSDGTCVSWGWMTVGAGYVPAGLSNVTAIAAGFDVSAALTSDGTVVNWGYTGYGGTGGNGLTGISAIAMGHSHGLALRSNGTVVVWGGTVSQPPVTLTNVVKIGAKQQWACALQSDGTLISWGYDIGQLNSPNQKLTNVIQLAPMNWAGILLAGDGPPQPLWVLSNEVALAESIVKFKGEAVGTEPLAYHWFFNGTNLPGAVAPTLTLSNVQPSQAGSYFVVVSNAFGVRTNDGAQLTVIAATITAQPTNQTAYGGDGVTMAVGAQGAGLVYQWWFSETNLVGETNAQLTLPIVTTNQTGVYSVSVSNSYGFLESSNATLTVVPIAITSPPASQSRYVGDSASFSVTAAKNGPFTYQWRHDGADLLGQTNASLTLANLVTNDAGSYSVFVANPYGSLESSGANLNVLNSAPIITSQPVSRGAYPGGSASFQVVADGTRPLTYQWLFNGTNIPGATATTLTLNNLAATNAGTYSVWVSNSVGGTLSANANLVFLKVVTWGATNNYGLGSMPLDLTNVLAIAAGNSHSVALKSNGRVSAWGYNYIGQTNVPAAATNVIAIAAGGDSALALKSNGTVVAWGRLSTVPGGLSNVIAIAVSANHAVALKSNGTVVAWGSGGATNVPASATNIIAIAAGESFTAALKADRTLTAWGSQPSTTGMTNVVAIAAGDFPLVALKADGKVVATSVSAVPANLSNVIAVAAGRYHALALRRDGTVTNWSFSPATPAGLTNIAAIASGPNHCLAILGNGPQPALIPFTDVKRISNSFSLSLPTQYGRLYWLEYKNSLGDPTWKNLPLNPGTGNPLTLTDTGATNAMRFYRPRWW